METILRGIYDLIKRYFNGKRRYLTPHTYTITEDETREIIAYAIQFENVGITDCYIDDALLSPFEVEMFSTSTDRLIKHTFKIRFPTITPGNRIVIRYYQDSEEFYNVDL